MSYDYNALVSQISSARSRNDLQTAVDTFGELSSHCPMTPLLWMQYASDSGKLLHELLQDARAAKDARLQTLELGLEEFPGCAMLRLQYLTWLVEDENEDDDENDGAHGGVAGQDNAAAGRGIRHAFDEALEQVGSGSHRNEGEIVVQIYNLYCDYLVQEKDLDGVVSVFIRRAATPMKHANDGLSSDFQNYCQQHGIPVVPGHLQQLEEGRRHVAQVYQSLVTCEDEVESQMDTDHVLATNTVELDDVNWDAILANNACSYWNGLGGHDLALVFIKYAGACTHYQSPRFDGVNVDAANALDDTIQSLALAIYERGVAECPTVEVMWTSYLKYLSYCVANGKPVPPSRLQAASTRAMRNCPYSLPLVQQRCKILFILAECGQAVLDPDELMATVETALKTKFLPHPMQQLELYLTAIRTVKRRLLMVLHNKSGATTWDDGMDLSVETLEPLSESIEQEVQDMCEDLRDMYEAADGFLRKTLSNWGEGRMMLWTDRSWTERLVLVPLLASLEQNSQVASQVSEDVRCFEKLTKVHQPTHPDVYAAWIQAVLAQPISMSGQVQTRLQRARGLYHKAVENFGSKPPKVVSTVTRDIDTAKRNLCHHFLEFETIFGSDKSLGKASRLIQKKLPSVPQPINATAAPVVEALVTHETPMEMDKDGTTDTNKRKSDDDVWQPPPKKAKPEGEEIPALLEPHEKATGWTKKPEGPKVRVGKLDYPAHPYTVRVTNLADDVEDMDLVDMFRPKCGAIVHAKIVREKSHHHKGKSKGWGMVQFEERDSVDKALGLSGVIGIKERLVKVDRSHMPATGMVPPGMHRVKPQGEGNSTKRNEKRKEQRGHEEATYETTTPMEDEPTESAMVEDKTPKVDADASKLKPKSSGSGVLAFQPRGVARKGGRKGPKMIM